MRHTLATFFSGKVRAGLMLFVLLLVAFAVYKGLHRVPPPPKFVYGASGSAAAQEAYWTKRVESVGGSAAYREFSAWAVRNGVVGQHTLAHAFGAGLYDVEGEGGIAVCDTQFSYGCFHVVLGKAIAARGLSEVVALDDACKQALSTGPGACEHGIGHGVAAYLGYTYDALTQALSVCDNLSDKQSVVGCFSGVFMEYNIRTMRAELATPRPVEGGDLFAPCDSLKTNYLETCAFWQPQWWMHGVYNRDLPSEVLYQKLGALCDRVGDDSLVRSCYQGLGNITPESVGYSPALSAVLCRGSSTSKRNQLYCISFAANVVGSYVTHEEGRRVCNGLTGGALSYCNDYADWKANLFHPDAVPAPETL